MNTFKTARVYVLLINIKDCPDNIAHFDKSGQYPGQISFILKSIHRQHNLIEGIYILPDQPEVGDINYEAYL